MKYALSETPIPHARWWFWSLLLPITNRLKLWQSEHGLDLSTAAIQTDARLSLHAACVYVCAHAFFRVLCSPYLEDLDGVGPVWVGVVPRFAIGQALCKHVQIENGVVLGVLDLALEQLHDVQESVQRAADVHDCRQKKGNGEQDVYLNMVERLRIETWLFCILMQQSARFCRLSSHCTR